jgi:uncharacterized protein YydD (DUF2326 family)
MITILGEYEELDNTKISSEQMIIRINDFINSFSNTAPAAKVKNQLDTVDSSNADSIRKIYEQINDLY